MSLLRHLLAAAIALLPAPLAATTRDEGVWINATVMGAISGRLIGFAEVQPRLSRRDGLQQLLLRPAVGWKVSEALSLYVGYLHLESPRENAADRNEERPFAQATWTVGKLAGGTLSSRTRMELRYRSDGDDAGWRLREMVRYVHPIVGDRRAPRALLSYEGFVALDRTDWGQRAGFDQGRAFAGFEVPLRGRSTLELGYMNQHVRNARAPNRSTHIASISLFVRP